MGQQVAHVEVVGKDADALRGFFGEMFGWKFSEPMGPTDYSVLEDQDGVGGGVGAGPQGYPGHVTFYVQVAEKAESLGDTRMMGPDEVPGVGIVIGLFSDPEGHVIGLMSPQAS